MHALAMFSVASVFAGLYIPATPNFESDYPLARKAALAQHKPLVVFVAAGEKGWTTVTREGGLSPTTAKALADNYVCVFVNSATPAGQKAVAALGLTGQSGLVISDRAGELQAFRHCGQLSQEELATRLVKYAAVDRVATTTETVSPVTPVNTTPLGSCPNCRR